jgi:CheY-like chemotaxis protein/tRNA A-37 threonylcarbamoyl transferase component Bud32
MKNVLVVDDNPIVRRHLRGLLERDGCVVSEAPDGARALALLDERTFDVMFLDLNMPVLDGAGVLEGLNARKRQLPVVLITSSDSSSEIVRAFKLGAKDYLLKPFREPQLRRALQQATGFDATTVQRTRTDLALLDLDEDFAQQLHGLLGEGDVLDHVDQLVQVPEKLNRKHQLVFIGALEGKPGNEAEEAEALGDLAAGRDPTAALVRLLPRGAALPEVTVFHAGVPRGDDALIKKVLQAVRAGGALGSGALVRAMGYSGPADLEHLYWWTLRNSLEVALERALKTGSRATVDLSLSPDNEERLNGLVDWVLEFAAEKMVEIAVVREPAVKASAEPVSRVVAPTGMTPRPLTPMPVTPLPMGGAEPATRIQSPELVEALKFNTRTGGVAARPASPPPARKPEPPMGDIPSPFENEAPSTRTQAAPQALPGTGATFSLEPVAATPARPATTASVATTAPPPVTATPSAAGPGIVVPGFELGAAIGEGGMSRVYKATQRSLRRQVCIKVMREEIAHDPSLADRFQDEGIALATLRHPNIVSVLDVGRTDDGQLYMVMEYIDGGDLRGLLGRVDKVPVREAVQLVVQLLGGLSEAHGHGIIHRDLKPSNVLLTSLKDGSKLVKLVDFGIAKLMEGLRLRPGQTRVGTVVGTPGYMAPEQLLGMEVSFATDLYAVGIILFELVTGRRPFVARDEFELAQLTMMTPVPHLREFGADLPDALDVLLNALLAKNPKDRPQSAAEVRATLAGIVVPAAA